MCQALFWSKLRSGTRTVEELATPLSARTRAGGNVDVEAFNESPWRYVQLQEAWAKACDAIMAQTVWAAFHEVAESTQQKIQQAVLECRDARAGGRR